MAELLVRFVFGLLFELIVLTLPDLLGRLGRWVARPVIPFLSRGRILLDPPPSNLVVVRRWHGVHHLTDGTPVLGKVLTGLFGLALLSAGVIILLSVFR
jgi:hypothetical protein